MRHSEEESINNVRLERKGRERNREKVREKKRLFFFFLFKILLELHEKYFKYGNCLC